MLALTYAMLLTAIWAWDSRAIHKRISATKRSETRSPGRSAATRIAPPQLRLVDCPP